jgi:hypothetical protein
VGGKDVTIINPDGQSATGCVVNVGSGGTPCPESPGAGANGTDTTPPQTRITKGPKRRTDSRRAKFRFTSSEPHSTFECRFDRKPFKRCRSPKKIANLKLGKHKFKVRATDSAGNTDRTPAKRRWRVVE